MTMCCASLPICRYWTYSYEGFHQRVKRIAKASNYKNVSKRIVRYWVAQFALAMHAHDPDERQRISNMC